ncbi:MAG: UvrD-helicase domain-containing protein [Salinivirgaceae bacterium]|nr:UvrD-helicase domain-containing protein [Salinivirgaceae bacterium]
MAVLTIYKASAGSGKTFQLIREYLSLIFNPKTHFSSILAVTFTNKATAEMRDRILNELFALANALDSGHTQYLKKLYNLSEDEIKIKAKFLLNDILYNYGRFKISTIDSFFQIILKSFTREIGLNLGFSLELNKKQILELSIEKFFETIQENKQLSNWLSDFAIQKIESGKSWDIQNDILSFTEDAFSELFFSFSEEQLKQFSDIRNLNTYKQNLNFIIDGFINSLRKIGDSALIGLKESNLKVDDFSYKNSGVAGFLVKQKGIDSYTVAKPGKRVESALHSDDFISGWCAKSSPKKDEILNCVQQKLHPVLLELFKLFETKYEHYISAVAILKSIDILAIIVEVFNHLINYCNEKNIFLLPLASPLLSKMIGSNDAPFIYEKTGEYLKHFMIDEFQDTSNLQWANFYPLFFNGISQDYKSLVVGDVKQSIYRWRNSDWTLLENQIQDQFRFFSQEEKVLPNNWRSDKNIVEFNNSCFKKIASIAQSEINNEFASYGFLDAENLVERIFSTTEQQVSPKKINSTGFVNVKFYEFEKDAEYNQTLINEYVIESLNKLFEHGFSPKDIAVLVRRNKEGAQIAQALMDYRRNNPEKAHLFEFVSNDSVFLGSSSIIQLLIALLEFIIDETNLLSKGKILQYFYVQNMSPKEASTKLIDIDFSDNNAFLNALPDQFKNEKDQLIELSLSQLVASLLKIFVFKINSSTAQNHFPFINAFQDAILNFTKKNGSDISGFIEWWYEFGFQTPINLSEEQNAIRIVTIHKSKGLEYKAVIAPFSYWNLDQRSKLMWCKPQVEPFNEISAIPVMYSSKLADSIFKEEYAKEKLMATIDSLNMLYVAFTRAEQALFIGAPANTTKKIKTVGDLLYEYMHSMNEEKQNSEFVDDDNSFTIGELSLIEKEEHPIREYPFDSDIEFSSNEIAVRIKSNAAIFNEKDVSQTQQGKILHKILENTKVIGDLEAATQKLVNSGIIQEKDKNAYFNFLSERLSSFEHNDWFSDKWKIMNEVAILQPGGQIRRPDRVLISDTEIVIVDYKFTKAKSSSHIQQIKEYMKLVQVVENKHVTGFVWYLLSNELHAV